MPSGKREAAQYKQIGALAAAQPEEIRQRREAAEQTYSNVLNRLGAKGTYEQVGGSPTSLTGPSADPGDPNASIFKTEKVKGAAATDIDRRFSSDANIQDVTKLDPEKTTKAIEGSSQFRTMSRLTAEAEQLVAREGPLWDEMIKNTQLPIIEGAGAMARENAEQIKRAMAKGGAARRTAFQQVEKIRSQERINSDRIQKIAQSRQAMDLWARENAQSVLDFGQKWTSNLGGIREEYNNAMDRASELMTSQALPLMMESTKAAAEWRSYAHAKQREKVGRWVKGIVGTVMMVASRGQMGASLIGEAFSSGTSAPGQGGGGGGDNAQLGSTILGAVGGLTNILRPGPSETPVKTTSQNGWSITGATGRK